jgi:hypothetical protein
MKQDPQQLSNQDLIEVSKIVLQKHPSKIITELITRFERLILGHQADEAIQELQQFKPQFNWEGFDVKPRQDDEVEALAEVIYLKSINKYGNELATLPINVCFDLAQDFINHRNERRGKK